MSANCPAEGCSGDEARQLYETRQLDLISARWDERAESWDRSLQDPTCHLHEDDAYGRFILEAQRVVGARRDFCAARGVIDAGCGTGLVITAVIEGFAWGLGLDLSEKMVGIATAKRIAKAQFRVGDCFNLSAACPPAGAVMARGVLVSHYGRELGTRLLAECRRTLEPGGFLLLDFLNAKARELHVHKPENKIYFDRSEIHAMALEAGFRDAHVLGEDERRVLLLLAERD